MKQLLVIAAATCTMVSACQQAPKQGQSTQDSTQRSTGGITQDQLHQQIAAIAAEAGGEVGVFAQNLTTGWKTAHLDSARYPMQSTFKFPIGMAILHQIDGGKLQLEQPVYIDQKWMKRGAWNLRTWSPLRDSFPQGNVKVPLSKLLSLMVSKSDNIACDILIDLAGGEAEINDYIHSLGVKDMAIVASEEKMNAAWDVQFTNWCHPHAYVQLLEIMNKGTALSKTSNDFLWKIMTETTTGPARLKGQLPPEIVVAHKTGTSGGKDGVTAATNDVGIIMLPNGEKLAIAVFVANSKADEATREGVIAKITKAVYDANLTPAK